MDPNQHIPQGGGNPQGPDGQQGNPQGPNGQQIRPPWPWPAYFPCCPWPWPPYFPPYLHYPFDAHVGLGIPGQGGAAGVGIQGQGGAMAGAAGVQNDGAGPRPINAENGGIPAQAVWVPDVGGNAPTGEQQGVAGRKRPRFNDEEASNISCTFKFYGTNHAPLTVVKDGKLQVHVPGEVPQQLAPPNAVHVPGADPQQVAPANAHVPVDDQGVAGRKRPRFNDEEASNISYTFKFYGTNHAPITVVKDENLQVHVPGAVPQQLAPANAVHVPGADPQQVAPANAHVPVDDQASNHL